MKISKFAKVVVTNASISFEALAALLRLINDVFMATVPQGEKGEILWDIRIGSDQGERISLLSFELEGKIAQRIQERVISYISAEIRSSSGGIYRGVEFSFVIDDKTTIRIDGGDDFVDLMRLRVTKWASELPKSRFMFFKSVAIIFSLAIAGIVLFTYGIALFATLQHFGNFNFEDFKSEWPFISQLSALLGWGLAGIAGFGSWFIVVALWPLIDLKIGKPTRGHIVRDKTFAWAKRIAATVAMLGGALAIYNAFGA